MERQSKGKGTPALPNVRDSINRLICDRANEQGPARIINTVTWEAIMTMYQHWLVTTEDDRENSGD